MAAVIAFERVRKDFATPYGDVRVIRNASFSVDSGQFVAITGPSGAGKSTLLNLAALLDSPTSGSVVIEGRPTETFSEPELCEMRKQRIGMVFQKYCLLPHRSVLENVAFRFRYVGHTRQEAREKAVEALHAIGLRGMDSRPARLLSGGEMQRVAIARAIALRPALLVADEPTGNLDRDSAETVMECFRQLNATGLTILLVTHNESLLKYCNRHMVFDGGVIGAVQQ